MTDAEMVACFQAIAGYWPHAKPLPETFALGRRLLRYLDGQAVAAAIEQFSLEGREFAPPLGLVARRAHELLAALNGSAVPDAHQAITEVYEWIRKVGSYGTPAWSHHAIGATIEAMGGWEATCLDDNPEAWRAHFLRLYETMRARAERETLEAPALAELRREHAARVALAPPGPPAIEVYVPPAGEPLADREALLEQLRGTDRQHTEPGAFRESIPRRAVTAHDFGDHQFCYPPCPDAPTPPADPLTQAAADGGDEQPEPAEVEPPAPNVPDLMAALEQSLAALRHRQPPTQPEGADV